MQKGKKTIRKRNIRKKGRPAGLKKFCRFCKDKMEIDYKNIELLPHFINSKGKITSRRANGNCARHQRKVANALKRARFLALLPYIPR